MPLRKSFSKKDKIPAEMFGIKTCVEYKYLGITI